MHCAFSALCRLSALASLLLHWRSLHAAPAHSAEADTLATYEILTAQLDKYEDLENDINFLADFSTRGNPSADMAGFIVFNDKGEECFSFGKYKGRTVVDVLSENPGYFSWIQQADFPLYTKKVLTEIKLRGFNS